MCGLFVYIPYTLISISDSYIQLHMNVVLTLYFCWLTSKSTRYGRQYKYCNRIYANIHKYTKIYIHIHKKWPHRDSMHIYAKNKPKCLFPIYSSLFCMKILSLVLLSSSKKSWKLHFSEKTYFMKIDGYFKKIVNILHKYTHKYTNIHKNTKIYTNIQKCRLDPAQGRPLGPAAFLYICVYFCIFVYMCVFMCICMYICVYLCIFGFWIWDVGFWILDFGCWISDFGFWIFGCWILDL